jgi:magnesium-transporting ATPase (P-type)
VSPNGKPGGPIALQAEAVLAAADVLAAQGLRVLALARRSDWSA